jgi:hypothetical protein
MIQKGYADEKGTGPDFFFSRGCTYMVDLISGFTSRLSVKPFLGPHDN